MVSLVFGWLVCFLVSRRDSGRIVGDATRHVGASRSDRRQFDGADIARAESSVVMSRVWIRSLVRDGRVAWQS